MAKFNIYGHVLYSEIEYEKLMNVTERIFINALMTRLGSIEQWTADIWDNIDHEYMIQTLEEIKQDILSGDIATMLKYSNTAIDIDRVMELTDQIANMYEINSIDKFRSIEHSYAARVNRFYKKKLEFIKDNDYLDMTEYLTRQIKDFYKIEQSIPYYSNGQIIRRVTPSTYLSMLYNVNLTRTGWNQTFKDAEYFEKDLMILETHPNSCPLCKPMQRKNLFKEW